MEEAILASASELVTVALKRIDLETETDAILKHFAAFTHQFIANTSGNAKEAVFAAQLPRALETNWLKLEIHPDPKYLMPDAIETLRATEELAKLGFIVLPFMLILFCASD
jgi:thiazole synthase